MTNEIAEVAGGQPVPWERFAGDDGGYVPGGTTRDVLSNAVRLR